MPTSVYSKDETDSLVANSATKAEFNSLVASVQAIADRVTKLETPVTPPPPTGKTVLYAPMFMWAGAEWDKLTALKQKYPSQEIVACFNPSNGDFTGRDTTLGNGLAKWKAAGIKIIGYVYTKYGARPAADVKTAISHYKTYYPEVSHGIFFDEMKNSAGSEAYYTDLTNYAHTNIGPFTMGNPGTSTITSYFPTVDCILIYESVGLPSVATVQQRTLGQPKEKCGIIPHTVPTFNAQFVKDVKQYVNYIYITNDGADGNPWNSLSSYTEQIIIALQ
jgi:hypothetical protein